LLYHCPLIKRVSTGIPFDSFIYAIAKGRVRNIPAFFVDQSLNTCYANRFANTDRKIQHSTPPLTFAAHLSWRKENRAHLCASGTVKKEASSNERSGANDALPDGRQADSHCEIQMVRCIKVARATRRK
jgi:hypothetical protein